MLMSNECIEISFVLCDDITLSFFGALFVPCLEICLLKILDRASFPHGSGSNENGCHELYCCLVVFGIWEVGLGRLEASNILRIRTSF